MENTTNIARAEKREFRIQNVLVGDFKEKSLPVFRRPGGFGGVSIPDPISNSAVNRSSANGTSS
jgi:hypothetical protein